MSFVVLPPEINSLRMFIGAGTAPMLAAAAAWDGLAEELGTAAQSFASVTAGLAGQAWQGPAALAMAAAAAPYAGWLTAAAAQSAGAAGQARAVASIFEAAQAATVLPAAVAANRDAFVQLVMTNLFGQNAPVDCCRRGCVRGDVGRGCGRHVGVLLRGIGDCRASGAVGEFAAAISGFGCRRHRRYWR